MLNARNIVPYSGPPSADIWVVGEAPGRQEEAIGLPFVGASGQLLRSALATFCDRKLADMRVCNAVRIRPVDNNFNEFLVSRKLASFEAKALGPVRAGKFIADDALPHVLHLRAELEQRRPNVVIALGNVALWALTGHDKISAYRGTVLQSFCGCKVVPTYHPAAVLRSYEFFPIFVADLLKAVRESAWPEIRRTPRYLTINPSLAEVREAIALCHSAQLVAVDIETACGHITRIGLAWASDRAISIPLCDKKPPHLVSYWPTADEETEVLWLICNLLSSKVPKVMQNGDGYDIPWLMKHLRVPVRGVYHDTMYMHHALMAEMPKALGFMGSVYTDMPAWKEMRTDYKAGEEKDAE